MSSQNTPQTPTGEAAPSVSEGAAPIATDSTTATVSASNGASGGDPAAAGRGDAEAGDGGGRDDGEEQSTGAEGAAEGAEGAAKKRRRRRKKKKPGEAGAEGASAEGGVAAQGGPASGGAAGGAKRPSKGPRHDKKPATDRTPFHAGEEVFGRVTAVLDAAIMVDLSGKALGIFDRQEMEVDDLVPSEGDRFVARVHQDGARGGLLVLTRKPLREEAVKPQIQQAAKDGTLVDGLVTGVIKGGVDVDLGGLRAFAPASGMDLHPQNANFAALVGQRLQFKVTQYEHNGRDVVVTRRPMLEVEAHSRRQRALTLIQEGQVMQGVVRTVVDWGIFVALPEAENLEGLVHATEATHDPRARLADHFKPGDKFEVKVAKVDDRGKIWLSRRALTPDPWREAKEKYPPGSRLTTTITRVEKFGAFCQLDGVEGLLHIGDLSINRVEDINTVIKAGDTVDVVVHQFDLKNHKVVLHPALTGSKADEEHQKITRNANLKVEVVKAEPAGVTVRVLGATGRAARGFIPAAQTGTERGADLRKYFPSGQKLVATVLDLDPRHGEPKLSIRRFEENEERSAHREYRKKLADEGGFGTLGDLLRKQLSK